jgi:Fic family protein
MAIQIPDAPSPARRPRWDPGAQHAALLRCIRLLDQVPPGGLTTDVLLALHRLVLPPAHPDRGRLRDGPVVIRLEGKVHRRPPAPEEAVRMTRALLDDLAAPLQRPLDAAAAARLAGEAWFWLTEAHPFRDGNGRVARALATWLLVRHGHALLMDPSAYCQRHKRASYEAHNRFLTEPEAWWVFFDAMTAHCFRRLTAGAT